MNWSLRAKLAALMVAGAAVPVSVSTYIDAVEIRDKSLADTKSLMEARAEQIAFELNRTHAGYLTAITRVAQFEPVRSFCEAPQSAGREQAALNLLRAFPASDAAIAGAGVVGPDGRVKLATDAALRTIPTHRQRAVRTALGGERAISDIDTAMAADRQALVTYLVPVRAANDEILCLATLWVRATPFWEGLRAAIGQVGPGSYAVMFDSLGIRIGHTFGESNLYHPAGVLEEPVIAAMAAESRFGIRTRELLSEIKPFPEQFARARDASPDRAVFRGLSPVTTDWTLGVARRLRSVPWTVFFMVPESVVQNAVSRQIRAKVLLSAAIVSIAALAGAIFASGLLWPIRQLREATERLAANPDARVPLRGDDELGQLAASFNAMAERLQVQELALRESNDRLEKTVDERTAALTEQQFLLASIIDNIGAAIYVKDLAGHFVLVNNHFLEIFGLERDAVIGHTDHVLMSAGAAETVRATDARVAQESQPIVLEEHVPQADGVHTYLSVKSQRRDAQGRVIGIFGVSTDITDRQQAQARQRAQLERMSLLDQMTTAIAQREDLASIYKVLTTSLEDRMPVSFACVLAVHPQHPDLLQVQGLSGAASSYSDALGLVVGQEVPVGENGLARCLQGTLVHEPDVARVAHPFPERLAQAGLRSLVLVPLSSEGRTNGILLAARAAPDAFGSGDCEFLRQLGDHVALAAHQARLHEQLRTAYDELRASQQQALQSERLRALGEMASGIAHDINNALSPVSVYVEALLSRETGLSEKARHYLQVIARGIDDVTATVARMREFYRADADRDQHELLDLNDIARQAADLTEARWRDQAQKEGRAVDLQLALAASPVQVHAVASEIREALVNLIFNAVDAMPAGGTLTLSTGAGDAGAAAPGAWIEVQDTGTGMDEATLRRCMEPFFTTKGRRGTGLGLAMVYGIAQRHGARVEIDSTPGAGTAVRLVFGPPDAAGSPGPAAAPEPASPAPLRLLVVDDDPQVLESLRLLLEMDGHVAVCCEGGERALSLLASDGEPFDVLVTDLGMPGVSGLELAAAAKERVTALPVILLTGWGQRLIDDGETPPNVDVVIGKPPKLRTLRAALGQVRPGHRPPVQPLS